MDTPLYTTEAGAEFSPCERYRYTLWRKWSEATPPLVVCMLNPSTATAEKNDPTVARCQKRAEEGGYGGLIVVNLFALRSTDPKALRKTSTPVGFPENDHAIRAAALLGDGVICGWGNHGDLLGRAWEVTRMLEDVPLWAFRLTSKGKPEHPLYVPYGLPLVPFNETANRIARLTGGRG